MGKRSTIEILFIKNNIDLALLEAGIALHKALHSAKVRTKHDKYYIKKGIKFVFNDKLTLATIEVIQGDEEFWRAWIKLYEIWKRTGNNGDKPSIHRINPDGHYEFGNIAVLSKVEHLKEGSKIVLAYENGKISKYESHSEFMKETGVKQSQMTKINKAFKAENEKRKQRRKEQQKEWNDNRRKG